MGKKCVSSAYKKSLVAGYLIHIDSGKEWKFHYHTIDKDDISRFFL
jgi:hypothetical protein